MYLDLDSPLEMRVSRLPRARPAPLPNRPQSLYIYIENVEILMHDLASFFQSPCPTIYEPRNCIGNSVSMREFSLTPAVLLVFCHFFLLFFFTSGTSSLLRRFKPPFPLPPLHPSLTLLSLSFSGASYGIFVCSTSVSNCIPNSDS